MKEAFKPGTMIYPLPAVLVSCGGSPEDYNLMTAAWVGTLCTDPPMCYVSIRPERHSYGLIKKYGEFVLNLTTEALAKATDWCGVKSGRDLNKWEAMGLHPQPGTVVKAPIVAESPLSIECRVVQILELGSHHAFIAEVVHIAADSRYMDAATGKFDLEAAGLMAYSHGQYYALGERLGHFGFSVKKPGTARKPAAAAGKKRAAAHGKTIAVQKRESAVGQKRQAAAKKQAVAAQKRTVAAKKPAAAPPPKNALNLG